MLTNKIVTTLGIFCLICYVVNSKKFDDFSIPKFGNSPVISEVRSPLPEGRPIKVGVTCMIPGSACKN